MSKNVFDQPLTGCGKQPLTGFYRDGCCNSEEDDPGVHSVCAVMTPEFLAFTRSKGNDLSTPIPAYGFAGLKPGDRWCLCASRWMEAYTAGVAPPVILEATHIKTLNYIKLDELVKYAAKEINGSGHGTQ